MITVSFANSNDRWIRSDSSTYGNVLFGNNLVVNEDDIGVVGQTYTSGTYYVRQYFTEFSYSRATATYTQLPVSGYFRFHNNVTHGTNVSRDTEIRAYDWGSSVGTDDWRRPSMLNSAEISGILEASQNFSNNIATYAGFMRVRGELTSSSATLRYFLNTTRNRLQQSPSGVEYNSFRSSRAAGTSQDPQLVVGHHTLSRMTTVLAAQTQLSDGTWIVVERPDTDQDNYSYTVKHRTTSGESTLFSYGPATGVADNDNFRSAQCIGLCRDKDDNFYIVRPQYENTSRFTVRAYTKSGGSTWSETSALGFDTLWDHDYSNVMQTLCTWHDMGDGRLVVYATRDWGVLGGAMESYYLFDATRLRANTTSGALLDSGRGGIDRWSAKPPNAGPWNPLNSTGTICDLITDPDDPRKGYILSGERNALLGENNTTSVGRYQIHSNGSQFTSSTLSFMDDNGGRSVYDPDAKLRAIAVGGDSMVKIAVDDRPDWGLTLDRFRFTSNGYNRSGQIRLAQESINSLPDPVTGGLQRSSLWDAVYFGAQNRIWVYYFDRDDSRRLMRTSINMNDNLALRDEIEVATNVGSAGGVIHSIRVQRNNMVSDYATICVAYETSVGSQEYQYVTDRINIPPTQPILNPASNFNANSSKQFTWTFSDPNFSDSQSAFQLRIIDLSDSSTAYDTDKTASSNGSFLLPGSSIANDKNYAWQVRTWDSVDESSPWSDQGTFATSNSGVVTIVNPAVDNEDIFTKDVEVVWDLTEASQDSYRVVVVRTLDNTVFLDTGWVSSASDSHTVQNLVSDVEYEIQVTTRSSLVESNTATRLVTVHYNTPEIPEISVSVTPGLEYVTVAVTNPEPRGDRPNPNINEVFRRVAGSGTPFQLVGECDPNSTFRDYTVGSGYRYEYKVRAGVEQ